MLAYSPLAFGVLSQPPGTVAAAGTALRRRIFSRLLPASEGLRQELHAIAHAREVSMVQVALNWCRAKGTTPIPGLRSPQQAQDVAAALCWSLQADEVQRLDRQRASCPQRMPANPFQSR